MEEENVLWKSFYVILAGRTNGAHRSVVQKFKGIGQTEVKSSEECDYCLVFCPVASRVGTDIGEALDNIPHGKGIILVVMHHTFNPDHVVAESRRQVKDQNVHLTVDCLFYEDSLLDCNLNDIMWRDIRRFFRVPNPQTFSFRASSWQDFLNCLKKPLVKITIGLSVAAVVIVVIVTACVEAQMKKEP